MARPISTLAVFFLGLNLFALMLQSTGVVGALGIGQIQQECPDDPTQEELDSIEACEMQDASDSAGRIDTGSSSKDTLFGMYNVLADQVMGFVSIVFPGLNLLQRAGVPGYITGLLGGVFSLIITIGGLSFIRGWGL